MSEDFYYPFPDVANIFDPDKVQALLGFSPQELEHHFIYDSNDELDAINAKLISQSPLSAPHRFKVFVLDCANLGAECHIDWIHHEPQLYVILMDMTNETWRYVTPYEGKRDSASDFLKNVRKVQDFLAQSYDLTDPQQRAYAQPDLIIEQGHDDLKFLEQLAAHYDLVVSFLEGSAIAHDIKVWSLRHKFINLMLAHPTPEIRDKVKSADIPRSIMQPQLHVIKQASSGDSGTHEIPLQLHAFISPNDIEELRPHFQRVADIMVECGEQDPSSLQAISADYNLDFSLVTRYIAADGTVHFERNADAIDLASCLGALMVIGCTIKNQDEYKVYRDSVQPWLLADLLMQGEDLYSDNTSFHAMDADSLLKLLKIFSIFFTMGTLGCLKPDQDDQDDA